MFKSEKYWNLKINSIKGIYQKGILSEYVNPERKSVSSQFHVDEVQEIDFESLFEMSPFSFSEYRLTFSEISESNSGYPNSRYLDANSLIHVGVSIM